MFNLLLKSIFILITLSSVSFGNFNQTRVENLFSNFNLKRPYIEQEAKTGFSETVRTDKLCYRRKLISLTPLIFELPEFLSSDEIEHLVSLATTVKLQNHGQPKDDSLQNFDSFDLNMNGLVSIAEIRSRLLEDFEVFLSPKETKKLLSHFRISQTGITVEMMKRSIGSVSQLKSYIERLRLQQPEVNGLNENFFNIYADEVFMNCHRNQILCDIFSKIEKLFGIPQELNKKSYLRLKHYNKHGKPSFHLDSADLSSIQKAEYPCKSYCRHLNLDPEITDWKCSACNAATLLIYLNDVPDGGETAFPLAGVSGEQAILKAKQLQNSDQQRVLCENSSLKISPKKGKVIQFFNHFDAKHENDTVLVGNIDESTWHTTCSVNEGDKLVAIYFLAFSESKLFDFSTSNRLPA